MIVEEIIKSYKLVGQSKVRLLGQSKLYESVFKSFSDEEKLEILNDYLCQKSNKICPTINDLRNFVQKYKTYTKPVIEHYTAPKPRCVFQKQELKDLFYEVLDMAHLNGIVFSPYCKSKGLKYGNKIVVVDGKFYNKLDKWREAISEAKSLKKEFFDRFQNLDFIEESTLARYCGFELIK